jgi:glycosyltransferase involved in cell wall biosynthesis
MMMIDACMNLGLKWLTRDRLSVLAFHAVPTQAAELPPDLSFQRFVEMLDLVQAHFHVLPLHEVVQGMARGKMPPHTACLTFDDGYPSWLEGAVPELQRRGLHATFYVTTGQFSGLPTWHERLASALMSCEAAELNLAETGLPLVPLRSLDDKKAAYRVLESLLKYQGTQEREELLLQLTRKMVGEAVPFPTLTEAQVRQVARAGFGIGAHTRSHPILALCDDDAARAEIRDVRGQLSDMIGQEVTAFAYPNGRPGFDFTARHLEMVRGAGYRHAVTTAWGAARVGTSPFEIPRFTPWGPGPTKILAQMARNLLHPLSKPLSHAEAPRPTRVLLVENGSGFGGAVIAAQNLVLGAPSQHAEFHVVSNLPTGAFADAPSVRSFQLIPDRHIDAKAMARSIAARPWPTPAKRVLQFGVGRLDDVANRLPYLLRLWRYAARLGPDIIHGNNDPASNREAMWVACMLGIPYVQHVRGAIDYVASAPELLKGASAFVPVSMWLAADLLKHHVPANRIRQIYDSVAPPAPRVVAQPPADIRQQLGLPPGQRLVAMVGMLVPWKGQGLFIDAIAQLPADETVTWLVVGGTPDRGDPSYAQALQDHVAQLGLAERVRFLGRIDGLSAVYPQFDVVVSASTAPEPLGLVMLEAMGSRCIFVGPAHGAAPEIVRHGHNGYLFEPRDASSLADSLAQALAQLRRPEAQALTSLAVSAVERFRPQTCAAHTIRVYQSVLDT